MLIKKIRTIPGYRSIVLFDDRLHSVLDSGTHWLWHGYKSMNIFTESVTNLAVDWPGIADALRFERETARKYWIIIDSAPGSVTLVWHQYLDPQIVPGGDSRAFWPPEQGDIQQYVMHKDDYRLPNDVQSALLLHDKLQPPLKKYSINAGERLLVSRRGIPLELLGEGEYILHQHDENLQIFRADTRKVICKDSAQIDEWTQHNPALIREHFERIAAADDELVLWSQNGLLQGYIAPGNHAWFWKNAAVPYRIIRVHLSEDLRIADDLVAALQAVNYQQHASFKNIVHQIHVPEQHQGLLAIAEIPQAPLAPGLYYYWNIHKPVSSRIADLRLQTSEVSGQELLSEDKVTIRANLICNWRITDALLWYAEHSQPEGYLYRELQFALRAVIGGKTIDGLLADKDSIDRDLTRLMRDKKLQGVQIDSVGIKDIILPGEIRAILTRVVEAEKTALANNIRRREETAATRSLLNTARVMEENPTALRLKELETLEKVTEKIDNISVFGGLDGVLNGLINIRPQQDK